MLERGTARSGDGKSHGMAIGVGTAAETPEAFTITAPIGPQDRVAASLFTYSDLYGAARRRLLRAYFMNSGLSLAALAGLAFSMSAHSASLAALT